MERRDLLKVGGGLAAGMGVVSLLGDSCAANFVPVRLGVVGGNFGTQFFFHEHPRCQVVGVSDLRADRRQRLQQTYHCDTAYDSLETMLAQATDMNAVAIFTEATNHAKHVKMAMEKGLHVLSAVPVCTSVEEAEELVSVAKSTGVHYMLAETSWYYSTSFHARDLVKSGKLGEIFYTETEYIHDKGDLAALLSDKTTRYYNPDGTRSWRWGYPPLLYPTHCTAFVVGVTGERIVKVSGYGWGTDDHPWCTENQYDNPFWNGSASMWTDQGHMSRLNVFWRDGGSGVRAEWHGAEAKFASSKIDVH
ncbi:MAG: Gfo/Idh/MocA family oxidoreductase, partial [Myxococcales bacterium]|nr:Gfo/Idh/MocA family oxidoreductase [Myxococcales bacterium]